MWNARLKMLTCAIAVAATASCGGSSGAGRGRNSNANTDGDSQPAIAITVGKSESRDVAATIQATGSLIADESSDIAPKTAGKISNVSANVGQFVSQGNTIATIDDKDAR